MKKLPTTSELLNLAQRVIWFQAPEESLKKPIHFIAYVMTYGTIEDLRVLARYVSESELKAVLEIAPAGVFDKRSWAYWNLRCGFSPALPMPVRELKRG